MKSLFSPTKLLSRFGQQLQSDGLKRRPLNQGRQNQALQQTRDNVLRYGESVGCELLNLFVGPTQHGVGTGPANALGGVLAVLGWRGGVCLSGALLLRPADERERHGACARGAPKNGRPPAATHATAQRRPHKWLRKSLASDKLLS